MKEWLRGRLLSGQSRNESPLLNRWFAGAMVVMAGACSGNAEHAPALSSDSVSRSADSPVQTVSPTLRCVPTERSPVQVSGTLIEQQKYGPPGYGETPARDERVMILVLRLERGIDVCGDSTASDPRRVIHDARELQLTGRIDPTRLQSYRGKKLTVFGSLYRKAWGTDYTDVLIRVDSIPELRSVRRGVSG